MSLRRAIWAGALALLPGALWAAPLTLPAGASSTANESENLASHDLPVGPWQDGQLKARSLEGQRSRNAWRVPGSAGTLELLAPLRSQLQAAGYRILFECDTDACGGFDFRFASGTLLAPAMHVDLGDFRFLSAVQGSGDQARYLSLMVSRSSEEGFVQITEIQPATGPQAQDQTPAVAPAAKGPFAERLEAAGHLVLDDLAFETGSSELGKGPFDSLGALAAYLKANPARTVALVGHTDAEGTLEANVALSKKRAASVVTRLTQAHGVDPAQISAEGMGFLSPRASNLTDDGRTRNRRVEAVLTSTR